MSLPDAVRPLRVGIVCPYSYDVPGGVQFHVRDLAEALIARGHTVSVLVPADDDTEIPDYMTAAGRAIPVRYNGAVARMTFGPVTAARVRKWLAAGEFDVLHLHEPVTPSLGMLALWIADGPIVATFHTALIRSRPLQMAYPLVRQSLEKISARIAVSEDARRTLVEHMGGDAVVIPNGVYTQGFIDAEPDARWTGTHDAPTIAFLGRLDEARKGLPVLLDAVPRVLAAVPGARFLVAGRGETGPDEVRELLGEQAAGCGRVPRCASPTRRRPGCSRRSTSTARPQTGGESFGIVLVEAMSAGAAVVASDLGAFTPRARRRRGRRPVHGGRQRRPRAHARSGSCTIPRCAPAVTSHAREAVPQYDWSVVTDQVLTVYEMVVADAREPVGEDPWSQRGARLRGRSEVR